MPTLIIYGVLALGILGALGGFVYKERQAGGDKVRAELQPQLTACNQALDIVRVNGKKAEDEAKAKEMSYKLMKDTADAENAKSKRDLAGLYAAYRSLRDQRTNSGSGFVSPAAPGSASPESITFDRSGLNSALSGFDKGVTGLLEEGDKAITDLNTAKRWAAGKSD